MPASPWGHRTVPRRPPEWRSSLRLTGRGSQSGSDEPGEASRMADHGRNAPSALAVLRGGVSRRARRTGHPGAVPLLCRSGAPGGGGRLRGPLLRGHPPVRRGRPRRDRRPRRRPGRRHPETRRHGGRHPGRPRSGWPATARSGCSPPTPTAAASPTSRIRVSSRSGVPGPGARRRTVPGHVPRRPRRPGTSSRCGRPCGPTTGGWPSSWPPPREGGPGASPSTSMTWTGPSRRSPGPGTTTSTGA